MLAPALGMVLVPKAIREYVAELPHPAGLMGCRASGAGKMSHDCCEYDIAVFGHGQDRLDKVGAHYVVELVHITGRQRDHLVALKDIEIITDSKAFSVSSALKAIGEERFKKALYASGRKALTSSLFYQQRFKIASEKQHQAAAGAMWLKIASYHLVAGTLAVFGTRPMPTHELAQARQVKDLPADMTDGIQAALECIGIERATRPGITRSIEATLELKSNDYDRWLIRAKIQHLLESSMLADCYYYAGKVAADNLRNRSNVSFFTRYAKLIQLAMDLSGDEQRLAKLQKSMSLAAKRGLRPRIAANSTTTSTFS
ncbi:MAG TPA: hypothetical protein VHA09_08755 [Nitrososphaera sp.]|nr:hypothetical protein [Nitrososphaera sp.]